MKALALLSGGLDSALAVKLVKEQGINVVAVNFTSPFCLCGKGGCGAAGIAKQLQISLKTVRLGKDFLQILKKPKFGYGRNMNPCIDCRILMFTKAKRYAQKIGASFLFTGEVLDERPMSQHRKALDIIDTEAKLRGKILRPLSARLLPETEAEKQGWIEREKLLEIEGRSRKKQIELAEKFNITDYPCPAGGCLLTYKEFAAKVRDLIEHNENLEMRDISLLKIGRHFRLNKNKIIVGRNKDENRRLLTLKDDDEYIFEVPDCGSPITLLQGPKIKETIETAAALTARYSDSKEETTTVMYGDEKMDRTIVISKLDDEKIDGLRIK